MNPIDIFNEIAVRVYGQDKVFLRKDSFADCAGNVDIHFPEIHITNSKGHSHFIRDIYVRASFESTGKMTGSLYGARGTQTVYEAHHKYLHSHLKRRRMDKFTDFCLGGGSEISVAVIKAARSSLNRTDDMRLNFSFLINYMSVFLEWESLEGTPYVRIGGLNTIDIDARASLDIDEVKTFLNEAIGEVGILRNMKVSYSVKFPFIIPHYNSSLEQYMQHFTRRRENVNENGEYVGESSETASLNSLVKSDAGRLMVGNEQIICKVIQNEETTESTQTTQTTESQLIQKRVPKIFRYSFERLLAERLSNWAVKNTPCISRKDEGGTETIHLTRSILENLVSVSTIS